MTNLGNDSHWDITHLKEARLERGLSIAEICRKTNLSYDNYIKYEKNIVKPQYMNLSTLQKISKMLGINLIDDYQLFKQNSSQIIKQYMTNNHLTVKRMAEIMNTSQTTIKNWRRGICSPSYYKWEKYFKDYKITE